MATASSPTDLEVLPLDWTSYVEPTCGKTYYVNNTNGHTQWEKPLFEEERLLLSTGWTSYVDPRYGNPYYVNEKTGETQWEKPSIEESQLPPPPAQNREGQTQREKPTPQLPPPPAPTPAPAPATIRTSLPTVNHRFINHHIKFHFTPAGEKFIGAFHNYRVLVRSNGEMVGGDVIVNTWGLTDTRFGGLGTSSLDGYDTHTHILVLDAGNDEVGLFCLQFQCFLQVQQGGKNPVLHQKTATNTAEIQMLLQDPLRRDLRFRLIDMGHGKVAIQSCVNDTFLRIQKVKGVFYGFYWLFEGFGPRQDDVAISFTPILNQPWEVAKYGLYYHDLSNRAFMLDSDWYGINDFLQSLKLPKLTLLEYIPPPKADDHIDL